MNMQHCSKKQMKSSSVQAAINGEDRKVNNAYNTDHMLIT